MILRDLGAALVIVVASIVLVLSIQSVPHDVKFIKLEDGSIIIGKYIALGKKVEVVFPDGEIFKGEYVAAENISTGFLFFPNGIATGIGVSGGSQPGYALLKGDKGTVMEVIFTHSLGHGFGEAKTNKGETYKVMF